MNIPKTVTVPRAVINCIKAEKEVRNNLTAAKYVLTDLQKNGNPTLLKTIFPEATIPQGKELQRQLDVVSKATSMYFIKLDPDNKVA